MRSRIYLKESNLRNAFEYFDKDGSGSITIEELRQVLKAEQFKIPLSELEKMIIEVDKNQDNMVDYIEFLLMMNNGPSG